MKVKVLLLTVLYTLSANISTIYADETEVKLSENIIANSAILIDAETGVELFSKNAHEKDYPASITKIMTALLAIEFADGDYEQKVEFFDSSIFGVPRTSSHIAMDVGETLPLSEALLAIMLESANEVSVATGELISGTQEKFAKLMTARAKELGATSTNFVNASGLPDPEHYTTAHDMAQIMREAVKHEKFIELITTKNHKIPPTEKQEEQRPLNNSHKMILPGQYFYEDAVGGKTGYTIEAQHTLVTYAKRGDVGLIAVILRDEKNAPYTDTAHLFDYGFSLYNESFSFSKDSFEQTISIVDMDTDEESVIGEATVIPEKDFNAIVPDFIDSEKVETEVILPNKLYGNVNDDEIVGSLNFKYDNNVIGEVDLLVKNSSIVLSASMDEFQNNEETKITKALLGGLQITSIVIVLLGFVTLLLSYLVRSRRVSTNRIKNFNYNRYRR